MDPIWETQQPARNRDQRQPGRWKTDRERAIESLRNRLKDAYAYLHPEDKEALIRDLLRKPQRR